MSLERTQHELARTAVQVAGIAVELNAVAKDLGVAGFGGIEEAPSNVGISHIDEKRREHLRLRALGLQAEAGRLALAALNARAAAEQIACASRADSQGVTPDHILRRGNDPSG